MTMRPSDVVAPWHLRSPGGGAPCNYLFVRGENHCNGQRFVKWNTAPQIGLLRRIASAPPTEGTSVPITYTVNTNPYSACLATADEISAFNKKEKQSISTTATQKVIKQQNTNPHYQTIRLMLVHQTKPLAKGKAKAKAAEASAITSGATKRVRLNDYAEFVQELDKLKRKDVKKVHGLLCNTEAILKVPVALFDELGQYDLSGEATVSTNPALKDSFVRLANLWASLTDPSIKVIYDRDVSEPFLKPMAIRSLADKMKTHPGYAYVRLLGHGTGSQAYACIKNDGFGFSLKSAARHGQAFGTGVYLAAEVAPTFGYAGAGDKNPRPPIARKGSCVFAMVLCERKCVYQPTNYTTSATFLTSLDPSYSARLEAAMRNGDQQLVKSICNDQKIEEDNGTMSQNEFKMITFSSSTGMPNCAVCTELRYLFALGGAMVPSDVPR